SAPPAATAAAPAATSAAAAQPTAAAPPANLDPNGIYIEMDVTPTDFDPGISSGSSLDETMQMFDGLADVYSFDQPAPLMAEKWSISDDELVWTFNLRKGAKWRSKVKDWDGTEVTAKDFAWTWKRNLAPETKSLYFSTLYGIKGAQAYHEGKGSADDVMIKATDDYTLQVTLTEPAPYFIRLVGTWTYLPLHRGTVEKNGVKWIEADNCVSNGPFYLDKFAPDTEILLQRNDNYWGEKALLKSARYIMNADPNTNALTAYQNSEVVLAPVNFANIDRVKADATMKNELHKFPNSGTAFLICDTVNNEILKNQKVRQALYLAIDRKTLNQNILKGTFDDQYADVVMPQGIVGFNPDAGLKGTLDDAKKLLADAGYPNGQGIRDLTMSYSSAAGYRALVAQYLQGAYKQLGINVKLNPLEAKAYADWRKSLTTQPFDFYLGNWQSDYEDPFNWYNTLWIKAADFYHSHWTSDEFEQVVAQATKATDPKQRETLYKQAETLFVSSCAVIPWGHFVLNDVIKPWMKDIRINRAPGILVLRRTYGEKH
ncbi:MAG TPA: peptide ABC transporter substrate-binding protein, partial [Thermomicrobiales bacterium]|nr:peptide ABC transporter substrate-binding protein [Thermomicrobiales bacterium]